MEAQSHIQVKHSELRKMLVKMTENRETPSPIMIYGGLGIGKSQTVLAHAKSMAMSMSKKFADWNKMTITDKVNAIDNPSDYYIFVDIRLSQKDPTDIYGIPMMVKEANFLEYLPHCWIKYFIQEKSSGLLFLDEINQATPLVTGAAFQLIHDRECGGKKLSNDVQIVAAGNREQDHANIYELSYPLRDRFREVELMVSVEEWSSWAYAQPINPSLIAFVNWNPSYLYRMIGSKPATPRSIAAASIDINGVAKSGTKENPSETFLYIAANLGEEWALTFNAYCEQKEKLDLKKIFANPSIIKTDKYDQAQIFALIGALTETYIANKNQDMFNNCLAVLSEMHDDQLLIGIRIMNGNQKA